jgi:hypothetical protein
MSFARWLPHFGHLCWCLRPNESFCAAESLCGRALSHRFWSWRYLQMVCPAERFSNQLLSDFGLNRPWSMNGSNGSCSIVLVYFIDLSLLRAPPILVCYSPEGASINSLSARFSSSVLSFLFSPSTYVQQLISGDWRVDDTCTSCCWFLPILLIRIRQPQAKFNAVRVDSMLLLVTLFVTITFNSYQLLLLRFLCT